MRNVPLLLALLFMACTSTVSTLLPSNEQQLLELHQAGLTAHLKNDVDVLLAGQADDFLLVNRGEISLPTKEQRRQFLAPYLAATKFDFYRDTVAPIVKVSRDGSLAWVVASVEARGTSATPDGGHASLEFKVAWVELYERRGAEWVGIGNVSSFVPAK